ncbi:MAG: kinase-like domain-containing protein [Piptocephalis tieghemiana]|nr:MAG: kinase-like domain-containing protein [Piptocephalis tieghemiana]
MTSKASATTTVTTTTTGLGHQVDNNLLPPPGYKEDGSLKTPVPHFPDLQGYTLMEKLGDGAFSQVYRALDDSTGEEVAIKVVTKAHLNPTQRTNILKEVALTRQLRHRNIVQLRAFFDTQERYYLVLEVIPGGELFHRIVRLTYFSEPLARHVALQIGEAIRFLHLERGVVHRDIKPENLLFDPIPIIPSSPTSSSSSSSSSPHRESKVDEGKFCPGQGGGGIGRVVLADFGLSKVVWTEETATPCGTIGYTAPEIVRDERYSTGVDMWALGCVLYTMLCGFPPFYDENVRQLTEKVARGQYTFLSPWWDDISPEAKDLVSHLLEVDPAKRYLITQFLEHPWCQGIEFGQPSSVPVSLPTPQPSSSSTTKVNTTAPHPQDQKQESTTTPTSSPHPPVDPTAAPQGGTPVTLGSPSPALNIPKRRHLPGSPATPLGDTACAAGGGNLVMKAALEVAYKEQRHREDLWSKGMAKRQRNVPTTTAAAAGTTALSSSPSSPKSPITTTTTTGPGASALRSTWLAASSSSDNDEYDDEPDEDDEVEIGIAGEDELVDLGYPNSKHSSTTTTTSSSSSSRPATQPPSSSSPTLPRTPQDHTSPSSRRRKRNPKGLSGGGFELNMDGSTLLSRRRQLGVTSGA